MRKITFTVLMTFFAVFAAWADDFKTSGDGTVWTMGKLATTEGTGVTVNGTTFTMANNVEIAEGDRFDIEGGIIVMLGDNVQLRISGDANFVATDRVLFTSAGDNARPYGIFVGSNNAVSFENIDFEYAGLRCLGQQGLNVNNCTFKRHNGVSNSSALGLGASGASFVIKGCTFEECRRSAIGCAANYSTPVVIEDCRFIGNGTDNFNAPQVNLTVASSVVLRNNTIKGYPEHNKVGGVVVSNLVGFTGDLNTLIEGNEIRDNRFGVAVYNLQSVVMKNNVIIGNKYETNAMNGGSGINIYDPNKAQTAVITGNYIEDNLWGITVIGGKNVNIGKIGDESAADYNPGLNVFLNNGNGGGKYDLYNNSDNTVYAQGNYWKSVGRQDEESIETVVYHKKDNPSLGEVIFMPALVDEPTSIESVTGDAGVEYVEVYTAGGVKVATMRNADLTGLASGLYIVRMATAGGFVTRKVAR